MSHFSVAVITKGIPTERQLEKIMAPYDENLEVITYETKKELIAKVREEIANYATSGPYAEYLADKEAYRKSCGGGSIHLHYIEEEFPLKLRWTDEECYKDAIKWVEPEDILPDGTVKNHYNPNSKWDWYVIGGRFGGSLYIKRDIEQDWIQQEEYYESDYPDYQRVDGAFLRDVCFPNAEEQFNKAKRFWEIYIEGQEPQNEEEKNMVEDTFYKREYYTQNYKTKENYIKSRTGLIPYAVVDKEGKWNERGQMGWFGMSSGDDYIGWPDTVKKILWDNIEDGDYITMLDCHI